MDAKRLCAVAALAVLSSCTEPDETAAPCASGCGGQGGSAPFCGDDRCDAGETAASCQADCGSYNCGDGDCGEDELCGTCADDCGACTGPPIAVTRGSYLQSGSSSGVTVRWRTAEPSASVVAFGSSGDALSHLVQSDE